MVRDRKRKAGKNVIRRSKTSWLRPKTGHVSARAKRVSSQKRKNFFMNILVSIVVVVILILAFGLLGAMAYSLKTGEKISVLQQLENWAAQTPFKVLLENQEDTKVEKGDVVGLLGIPKYPNSEFIFDGYVAVSDDGGITIPMDQLSQSDGQALYTFLSGGQSVYRLPLDTSWEDVQSYYQKSLTDLGWKLEISVPVTDLDRIPGEYYTKGEKGVHIYQVSYDIWYETITKVQAEDGLRDMVVAYKAKQELVAAASGKDLPEDVDWEMKYSRDWDLETQDHPTLGVKNLYFTHYKSKERVVFLAVKKFEKTEADLEYKDLENVGIEHIATWLATQPAEITLGDFRKTQLTVAGSKAIEFYDKDIDATFLIIYHPEQNIFYVVQYSGTEKADFIQYIKDNLKISK